MKIMYLLAHRQSCPSLKLTPSFFTVYGLCIAFVFSCSDDGERRERVSKLRAVGVEQTPVNAKVGEKVNLVFHLAGPSGLAIDARSYLDTVYQYGSLTETTLLEATPVETVVGGLSLYALRAEYTVAADGAVLAAANGLGKTRIRYGIRFATSDDEETIVGDTLVYRDGSPELTWTKPAIEIKSPVEDAVGSTVALQAAITSTNEEGNRISWFVSGGKVKTYNSKSTEWSEIPSGSQTVILTVRGTKSGSFAIKTKSVTVQ